MGHRGVSESPQGPYRSGAVDKSGLLKETDYVPGSRPRKGSEILEDKNGLIEPVPRSRVAQKHPQLCQGVRAQLGQQRSHPSAIGLMFTLGRGSLEKI